MKYLLIMQIDPAVLESLTEAQGREIGTGHGRFMEEITRTGELIGTQALADPSRSAVVSVRDGATTVTDGPFVEAKEHIGGFYIVNAETLDDALRWAEKVVEATNHAIEVRPFRATGRLRAAQGH